MSLLKCCTKCGERKPLAQFPYRKERGVHEAACKICASMRTQNWMERKLRLQLKEAYEAGAEDGYHNIADKETRDTYVEGVMKK